jgi:chromosome partitioning protein
MNIITFFNEKGGVGKTTLATALAAALAIRGKRVLLIDADAQANAGAVFGIAPYAGLYDLLVRGANLNDVILTVDPQRIAVPDEPLAGQLYLIGSNIETQNIATSRTELDAFLVKMLELDNTGAVDTVIVDTPPTPSLLHGMLYMATDGMIIPTRLEAFSMTGVARTLKYRETYNKMRQGFGYPPIELHGIVPVATELGTMEHAENLKYLHTTYTPSYRVYRPLHKRIRWSEAIAARRSLFAYDPVCQAAQEAWGFVDEVLTHASA